MCCCRCCCALFCSSRLRDRTGSFHLHMYRNEKHVTVSTSSTWDKVLGTSQEPRTHEDLTHQGLWLDVHGSYHLHGHKGKASTEHTLHNTHAGSCCARALASCYTGSLQERCAFLPPLSVSCPQCVAGGHHTQHCTRPAERQLLLPTCIRSSASRCCCRGCKPSAAPAAAVAAAAA